MAGPIGLKQRGEPREPQARGKRARRNPSAPIASRTPLATFIAIIIYLPPDVLPSCYEADLITNVDPLFLFVAEEEEHLLAAISDEEAAKRSTAWLNHTDEDEEGFAGAINLLDIPRTPLIRRSGGPMQTNVHQPTTMTVVEVVVVGGSPRFSTS
ncbi:hypothetical protein DL767_007518 [Monosporascus sp. MG133]|nr:hypothetical protein DL767_007518 [Monosporascus sp. MG133]